MQRPQSPLPAFLLGQPGCRLLLQPPSLSSYLASLAAASSRGFFL